MRFLTLVFVSLLISHTGLFCQIRIDIYLFDHCLNTKSRLIGEIVDSIGETQQISKDTSSFVKAPGTYFIAGQYVRNGQFKLIPFDIKVGESNNVIQIEIYKLDKFFEYNSVLAPEKYYYCDRLCEGKCLDYYENGQVRIYGTFKSGVPKRKIVYFNRDGSRERVERFDRRGIQKSK